MSVLFKKIIAVFIVVVAIAIFAFSTCNSCGSKKTKNNSEEVYVCNSEGGKNYHKNKECNGLQQCTHDIIKMSKSEAKKRKLDKCDICY